MSDDRVKTKVVGHVPPRYPGEAKSRREIHQLIEPILVKPMDKEASMDNGG